MAELRKINCDLGTLSRADGSAIYASGETCVAVSVNGPCVTGHRKLNVDEAFIDVTYRPRCGNSGIQEKLIETTLRRICEVALLTAQHPRTMVAVTVQEMHDSGGLAASCINGLCLALMHSGLPMTFAFAAVCCSIDSHDNILVDPDHKQLKGSKAVLTVTLDQTGRVVSSDATGVYTLQQFNQMILSAQTATAHIFAFYRDVTRRFAHKIAL